MKTLWSNEQLSVGEVVELIDAGGLALPRFQRPFVWSSTAQRAFLAAVLRNLPTGALLILEVDQKVSSFAPVNIEGAPALSRLEPPERLILDGQQRMTSVYWAFSAAGSQTALVDVKAMLSEGVFLDEHLAFRKGSAPSIADQAKQGVVALSTIIDQARMLGWYRTYTDAHLGGDDSQTADVLRRVENLLPGVKNESSHQFPIIKIAKGAPLSSVVAVFEGINRRGTQLSGFDLMVARLYQELPSGDYFDLRKVWDDELSRHPRLQRFGLDIGKPAHAIMPLQVIALAVSRVPIEARPPEARHVRGVKQSDILELPVNQVISGAAGVRTLPGLDLGAAFDALSAAVSFLADHCGVRQASLMPQISMLIPLADHFLLEPSRRLKPAQLKQWFFGSGLLSRYYGSVNSFVEADAKQLRAWGDPLDGSTPEAVRGLTKEHINGLDLTQPAQRDYAILSRSIMALLIAHGAYEWGKGQIALRSLDDPIQIHHTVPQDRLKKLYGARAEVDWIAALTPITESANASLRDKSPSDVYSILGPHAAPILRSHMFTPETFERFKVGKQSVQSLLRERDRALKAFVIEVMGI